MRTLPTGTITFFFTDIEGSTRLWEHHPEAMGAALQRHDALLRSVIESKGGYVFKTVGDAFCAAFASAGDAVEAGIEAQQGLQAERWPQHVDLRVRMALHTGKCEERDGDYFGPTVNRTARLEATAHGRQVVLSQATAVLVRDRLPDSVELTDLGSHRLKDLARPEQIFQLNVHGLEVDFPPLRSLDNPALPNNLPAQPASFVGRTREAAEVRLLVEDHRLVTLTGAGGSGKTRLALQVAAELLDGSGDGVWLVELAPISDESLVATTMEDVLGITRQPGRPEFDALVDALEPQRTLIVLDNCEHLIGSCAKIADTILRRCPGVHLMATSRQPLGIGGEAIYRVPSLSLPDESGDSSPGESDAVALFMDRARSQRIDLTLDEEAAPLLASICRRLDGMPLAIELAAARLRSMSIGSLHDRLDHRFRLLTGGSRSALPRQQTLRATMEWSYSLLNEPEQSLLRRLSVFAEGFDLEAAETVCSLSDMDVFDIAELLGSLVDKSLVVAEPMGSGVRYRLLETIRQFGAEHLVERDATEAEAVATAHCRHFLSLAEQIAPQLTGPEQGRGFARLDADFANLRRSIEYSVDDPRNTTLALRFAAALHRYGWVRSRANEVIAAIEPVLDRPAAAIDPELLVRSLLSISTSNWYIDHQAAQRLGEWAVTTARELEDDRVLAEALACLSVDYASVGRIDWSLPLSQEAVQRARALDDDVVLSLCLACDLLAHSRSDLTSINSYDEAIASAERAGDLYQILALNNNAGCLALQCEDVAAARRYFERAQWADHEVGMEPSNTTGNLAWVAREEGDAESANRMFREALLASRRAGDRTRLACALLGFACLAGDSSAWRRSAVLHAVAQAVLDKGGEQWPLPEVRYREINLGEIQRSLDGDQFQVAFAEGRTLSLDDAIELSLGRRSST